MVITDEIYRNAEAFLMKDGNFRVPCSRYGFDTASCVPPAIMVAAIVASETDADFNHELLNYTMGLVVNNHDDVQSLLDDFGAEFGYEPMEG